MLSEVSTPCSIRAETTRRAWRSPVPTIVGGVAARQFAAIEHGFEDGAGFWRQLVEPDFFFRPQQDARAQLVGLHQAFHEDDLIDAGRQEESGEFRQRFLAQIAPAVEIVAARQVAGGKVAFVGVDIAREAARDRPDPPVSRASSSVACDIEPGDAAVAVEEGVNPRQAVVRGRRRDDGLGLAEFAVDLFEALEEARHSGRADGNVLCRPRHRGDAVRRG